MITNNRPHFDWRECHVGMPVIALAWDPRTGHLVAGCGSGFRGEIAVLDASGIRVETRVRLSCDSVRQIVCQPSRRIAAVGDEKCQISLRRFPSGKLIWNLPLFKDDTHIETRVGCLAFDPSGDLLGGGFWDLRARVWSCKSGRLLFLSESHDAHVGMVAFLPGNILAAATAWDIWLYDLSSDSLTRKIELPRKNVWKHVLSFDRRFLASVDGSGVVTIWSTSDWSMHTFQTGAKGFSVVAASPVDYTFAVSPENGSVWLGDFQKRTLIRRGRSPAESLCGMSFSPDGRRLACYVVGAMESVFVTDIP